MGAAAHAPKRALVQAVPAGTLVGDEAIRRPIRTVFIVRRPPHPAVNSAINSVGVLSIG